LLHIKAPSQSSLGFDRLLSSQGAAAAAYRGSQDPSSAASAQSSSARHLQSHQFNLLSSQLQDQSSQLYNASVFSSAQPQPQSQSNSAQERAVPRQDSVIKHYQRPTPAQSQLSSSAAHSLQHYLSCGGAGYQQIATHHRHAGLSCSPLGEQSPSSDHKPPYSSSSSSSSSSSAGKGTKNSSSSGYSSASSASSSRTPHTPPHPSNSIPTSSSSATASRQQPPPQPAPPPPARYGSPVPPGKNPTSALTGQTPPQQQTQSYSPNQPPTSHLAQSYGGFNSPQAQDLSSGTGGKGYGSLGGRSQSYPTDLYGADSAYGSLPSSLGGAGSPSLGYGAPGHSPALLRSSGSSGSGASGGGSSSGTGNSSPSPSGNSGIIRPGLHSPVPACPTQSPGGAASNKYISSVLSPTFLASPQGYTDTRGPSSQSQSYHSTASKAKDTSMLGVGSQRSQEEVDDDDEFLIQHLLQAQASPAPHHPQQQAPQQTQPQPQPGPPAADSGKGLSYDMGKSSEERYHPQSVIRTHSATSTGNAGSGGSISGLENQLEMSQERESARVLAPADSVAHPNGAAEEAAGARRNPVSPENTGSPAAAFPVASGWLPHGLSHRSVPPAATPPPVSAVPHHPQQTGASSTAPQDGLSPQQQAVMEGAGGALGSTPPAAAAAASKHSAPTEPLPPPSPAAPASPPHPPAVCLGPLPATSGPTAAAVVPAPPSAEPAGPTARPVEKADQNQQSNRFVPLTSICFPDSLLQDEDRSFFPGMEDMFCAEDYKKAGPGGGGAGGSGGAGYDMMGHHGGDQGYEPYCHGLQEPSNSTMTLDLDSLKGHELPSTVNTEQLGLIQSQGPAMGMGPNSAGPNNSGAKMSSGPGGPGQGAGPGGLQSPIFCSSRPKKLLKSSSFHLLKERRDPNTLPKKSYAQEYEFEDDEDKADQPADIRLNSRRLPDLLPDLVSSCRSGSLSPLMGDIDFYHSSGYSDGPKKRGRKPTRPKRDGPPRPRGRPRIRPMPEPYTPRGMMGELGGATVGAGFTVEGRGRGRGRGSRGRGQRREDIAAPFKLSCDCTDPALSDGSVGSAPSLGLSPGPPCSTESNRSQEKNKQKSHMGDEKDSESKAGFVASFLDFLKTGKRPPGLDISPGMEADNGENLAVSGGLRPLSPAPAFGDSEGNGRLALGNCPSPKRLEDELKRNLETLPSFSSDEEDSVGKNQDLQKSISSAISALYDTPQLNSNLQTPLPPSPPQAPQSPLTPTLQPPTLSPQPTMHTPHHLPESSEPDVLQPEDADMDEHKGEGNEEDRNTGGDEESDLTEERETQLETLGAPNLEGKAAGLLSHFRRKFQFCFLFNSSKNRAVILILPFFSLQASLPEIPLEPETPEPPSVPVLVRQTPVPLPNGFASAAQAPPKVEKEERVSPSVQRDQREKTRTATTKEPRERKELPAAPAERPPKSKSAKVKAEPPPKKRKRWLKEIPSSSDSDSSEEAASENEMPVKGGVNNRAMREMFRSYVEMLVSTALDPDMIQALEDTDDELYLPPMRKIDSIISEQKRRLLRRVGMSSQHQEVLHAYPQIIVDPLDSGAVRVRLSGDAYNRKTLNRVKKTLPKPQDLKLSAETYRIYSLFHSLHHYKYHTFLQCKKETNSIEQAAEDPGQEEVVQQCMANQSWLDALFGSWIELLTLSTKVGQCG
uniref:Proline rich 12a n=1 Tax=Gasterosteus aculeatus TaxID=69293 RepID=G3NYY0_GASAC